MRRAGTSALDGAAAVAAAKRTAVSVVVHAVESRLAPELAAVRSAVASGTPTAAACESALTVLERVAPLLGPNENAMRVIAQAARRSALATPLAQPGEVGGVAVGAAAADYEYSFGQAEAQQRLIGSLFAERDAANAQCHAQRAQLAGAEAALAAARAQLAEKSDALDQMMRDGAAMRADLAEVQSHQKEGTGRVGELLRTGGHATRVLMEEERRLKEKRNALHNDTWRAAVAPGLELAAKQPRPKMRNAAARFAGKRLL